MRKLTVLAVVLLSSTAAATAPEARWKVSAETDLISIPISLTNVPSYSLHVGLKAPQLPNLLVGVGVFGSRRLPDFFTSLLDAANGVDNSGFSVGADGVALRTVWYFSEGSESGFFAGAYWAWQRWRQTHDATGAERQTNQLLLWPAAGYRWFPGGTPIFLSAFLSAGITSPSFGTVTTGRGAPEYQELRWYPFGAVHLGFEL